MVTAHYRRKKKKGGSEKDESLPSRSIWKDLEDSEDKRAERLRLCKKSTIISPNKSLTAHFPVIYFRSFHLNRSTFTNSQENRFIRLNLELSELYFPILSSTN